MTQFAVFIGPKPEFESIEAVPLSQDCVQDYAGNSISQGDLSQSWVLRHPDYEVIDDMCCHAQKLAQLENTIEGTDLYNVISPYLSVAKGIVFFYATESDDLLVFHDRKLFLNHIRDSLSGKVNPSMEIYGKFTANT